MSKELTPLEAYRQHTAILCCDVPTPQMVSKSIELDKIVETALKRIPSLEKALKEEHDFNNQLNIEYYEKEIVFAKEHKALEIIKDKKVNVANFIYWLKQKPRTYEDYLQDYCQEQWYLHYKDNNDDRCKFYKLAEEEYDLLKEVLL